MAINMPTLSSAHTRAVVCSTRKESTLPQGGGAEADRVATRAIHKLLDQLLHTGSILTHLSSLTQNYFCSSHFHLFNYLLFTGFTSGITLGTLDSFMILTWRNTHCFHFFLHHLDISTFSYFTLMLTVILS